MLCFVISVSHELTHHDVIVEIKLVEPWSEERTQDMHVQHLASGLVHEDNLLNLLNAEAAKTQLCRSCALIEPQAILT